MIMIDIKRIISSIDSELPEFNISNLVCDILVMSEKIEKLDKTTYYYETVKEIRENSLIKLRNDYFKAQKSYSSINLQRLYKQRTEIKNIILKIGKLKSGTIKNISLSFFYNELSIVDDYIKMKTKFDKLKNIRDYSNNDLMFFFSA